MTTTDQLTAIEARANDPFVTSMQGIGQVDADRDALLAMVRQQRAAIERAKALHVREVIAVHEGYGEEAWCPNCRVHWPCEDYAALTATEGA